VADGAGAAGAPPGADAAYAYGRIALGGMGLVAPRPVGRLFGLGDSPAATVAARHIAARDLVAGVGMVMARRRGRARGWYEAAALTDAIDAGIAIVAGVTGALPRRRAALVALMAGGSAATGWLLARQFDEESPSSASPLPPS
jgi:hypothetical protein